MSNLEPIAAGKGEMEQLLSAQIDSAAVQIVLGTLDSAEQFALLQHIYEQAKAAVRPDIVEIVRAAIDAASKTTDSGEADALLSDCITRVQHALCSLEPISCPSSSGSASAIPSSVPLGEDRELLGDFILESRDHLTQVELQIITLEKNPKRTKRSTLFFALFIQSRVLRAFSVWTTFARLLTKRRRFSTWLAITSSSSLRRSWMLYLRRQTFLKRHC